VLSASTVERLATGTPSIAPDAAFFAAAAAAARRIWLPLSVLLSIPALGRSASAAACTGRRGFRRRLQGALIVMD